MKTENSCYKCPNRKEACHDNCEVYKAWKAEYQRKEKEETKTRKWCSALRERKTKKE